MASIATFNARTGRHTGRAAASGFNASGRWYEPLSQP
jgi:hypothetical protein